VKQQSGLSRFVEWRPAPAILSMKVLFIGANLGREGTQRLAVAQVSKPAGSPISKSAELRNWWIWRIEKPATSPNAFGIHRLGSRRYIGCGYAALCYYGVGGMIRDVWKLP
jgi:hypothetical protein